MPTRSRKRPPDHPIEREPTETLRPMSSPSAAASCRSISPSWICWRSQRRGATAATANRRQPTASLRDQHLKNDGGGGGIGGLPTGLEGLGRDGFKEGRSGNQGARY